MVSRQTQGASVHAVQRFFGIGTRPPLAHQGGQTLPQMWCWILHRPLNGYQKPMLRLATGSCNQAAPVLRPPQNSAAVELPGRSQPSPSDMSATCVTAVPFALLPSPRTAAQCFLPVQASPRGDSRGLCSKTKDSGIGSVAGSSSPRSLS